MRLFTCLFFSTFILFSCGNSAKTPNATSEKIELAIEGMTCKMGCGGTICKNLEKIEGVSLTDLSFDADNPIDVVTVEFDSSITSPAEMKEKVESLAGGVYQVKEIR